MTLIKAKTVLWYDKYKGMNGNIKSKARKFVKNGCVEMVVPKFHWIVKPIKGYNSTTYDVTQINDYASCNCQYNKLYCRICSHIVAVELFEEIKDGSL